MGDICKTMDHTAAKRLFDGTDNKAVEMRKLERNAFKRRLKRAKHGANADPASDPSPDETGAFRRSTARPSAATPFFQHKHVETSSPAASRKETESIPLEIVERTSEPSDRVLDDVAAVLRHFYEVESAVYAMARRGTAKPTPVIGLRIHAGYPARTVAILDRVRQAAANAGLNAEVLLLDKTHVRSIRSNSLVFFPWRRRAES